MGQVNAVGPTSIEGSFFLVLSKNRWKCDLERPCGAVDLYKAELPLSHHVTEGSPLQCRVADIVQRQHTQLAADTTVNVVAEIEAKRVGRQTTADGTTVEPCGQWTRRCLSAGHPDHSTITG